RRARAAAARPRASRRRAGRRPRGARSAAAEAPGLPRGRGRLPDRTLLAAAATIAWLARLGYLDDGAYAGARARALLAPGRLGPRAAERRLRGDGIPPAAARQAVAAAVASHAPQAEGGAAQE